MTPPRYLPLLGELDAWHQRAHDEHPGVIPCAKGCSHCCHGPFDITIADVELVAGAVRALEPEERARVRERAGAQVQRMLAIEPEWTAPYDVGAIGEARFDRICDALETEPCPMLDAGGGCSIYAHRPMICRLMGLGLVTESGDVIENGCPIQERFPAFAALAPQAFALEAWEVREEAAKEAAAIRVFGTAGFAGFETTIAAAVTRFG